MKRALYILFSVFVISGCSSQKELAYLNNLSQTGGAENFSLQIPDYKIQPRDLIYVTVKTQTPEGNLVDVLIGNTSSMSSYMMQTEASQFISGYAVDPAGSLNIPLLGKLPVAGKNIYEIRGLLQDKADSLFRHSYVEARLLSFRFTVLGEVRMPGSYVNYNDQLTVLEAIGNAGGITDQGSRSKILVVRPVDKKTETYTISLQDKNLLESPAYFLTPNDVVIVQPNKRKVFNLNLPTYSFVVTSIVSAITTTILLVKYLE